MLFCSFLKQKHLGPMLIVTAAVLWALDGIIRRSLFALSPITIVFYEHAAGTVILLPVLFSKLFKRKLSTNIWIWAGIVALVDGLLGTLWFTTALLKSNFMPFSVVFLLQKTQPVFAILTAHFLLKEKLTKRYAKWAVLALVAAFFVTFPLGRVNLNNGAGTLIAALYALGAAVAWGSMTAGSKVFLKAVNDNTLATGLRFLLTTIIVFPILLLFSHNASASLTITSGQALRFVFIALSTGMVALWIYYRGLAVTQAKISTLLELVFPMLAVIIDAVLYKTVLHPTQYLAAIVLMFVVWQLGKQQKVLES